VWGKELYIDSTKTLANASPASMAPRFAAEAHLESLVDCKDQESEDQPEQGGDPGTVPVSLPTAHSEDASERLTEANSQRHDWIAEAGRQNRAVGLRDYQRIADRQASRTDPDASLMRSAEAGSHPGYQVHYVVDGGKARIIRTVLVAPYEVMENLPMRDLICHTCFRWKVVPLQVTGDAKYGTIENIVALEDMGIRGYLALPDYRVSIRRIKFERLLGTGSNPPPFGSNGAPSHSTLKAPGGVHLNAHHGLTADNDLAPHRLACAVDDSRAANRRFDENCPVLRACRNGSQLGEHRGRAAYYAEAIEWIAASIHACSKVDATHWHRGIHPRRLSDSTIGEQQANEKSGGCRRNHWEAFHIGLFRDT